MEWMPSIRVDGTRSTGPVNSMFFIRLSTSDTRVAASTRPGSRRGKDLVAAGKCQVRVGLTSHIEAIGIDEVGLVPVGRRVLALAFSLLEQV